MIGAVCEKKQAAGGLDDLVAAAEKEAERYE